jgi:SPP1 family predicted phage head-tail adaptor
MPLSRADYSILSRAAKTKYSLYGGGKLKHIATFAKRMAVEDAYGNETAEWRDQFTIPASVRARLGGEDIIASRLSGVQPYTVSVRQCDVAEKITTDWKVRIDDLDLELSITSIADPHDERAYFDILCQSGVAQ